MGLVLVLLGALWASILLSGALRTWRASSPLDTVTDFERSMSTLRLRPSERVPGRTVLVLHDPASVTGRSGRARQLARRRAALKGLVVLLAVTALLALVGGDVGRVLFALSVIALGTYVAMLRSLATSRTHSRAKTRRPVPAQRMPPADAAPVTAERLRRSA
jgi:hypothetical protein